MPLDNNFFKPEEIDKQIEDLSRKFQENLLEEYDQENMRLMQHIRRFYRANPEEDTHALNSAWQRIANERMHAKIRINEKGQVSEMQFSNSHARSAAKKTLIWRRLGVLAAVMLMGALVGSMLLVFSQVHQSKTGNNGNFVPPVIAKHKPVRDAQLNLYTSDQGSVYKVNSKTGKKDWVFNPHSSSIQLPLIIDGVVYFSSWSGADPYVYALNASNGTLRWKAKSQSLSAVTHAIIYTTHNEEDNIHSDLDALDAGTGKLLWHYNPGLQADRATISNGVLYGTGSVDMSNNSALYALDATTGKRLWSVPVQDQFFNLPQIVNNVLYVTSTRDNKDVNPPTRYGYVYAFNAQTGKQLWRTAKIDAYIPAEPTIAAGIMYIVTNDVNARTSYVYAMHSNDGTVLWKRFISGDINGAPLFINSTLYLGVASSSSSTGAIYVLALKVIDGSTLWSHALLNFFMIFGSASLAIDPHGLYVGSSDGQVLVLDLKNGMQIRAYQVTPQKQFMIGFSLFITLAP